MRIAITGNLGYAGPCVTRQLRMTWPNARIVGVDTGYFADCALDRSIAPENEVDQQVAADIRELPAGLFSNVDAVIHLAALSNDPMGKTFEDVTNDINYRAGMEIARRAKKAGVKSFVFASSCSVYGSAQDTPRNERSEVDPLTAYARSKVAMENGLRTLAGRDFTVTCLRFATACGMSPRLRLDLVLNDFVASAVTRGEIRVLSNGEPWRPLIHVRDMARAIDWASARPAANGGNYLVVNAGSDGWTWRVSEMANAVADAIPGVGVSINRDAPADKRSYRVDFSLFRRLAPLHQPREKLAPSILEMKGALEEYFAAHGNDVSPLIRLRVLSDLVAQGRLNPDLTWVPARVPGQEANQYVLAGRL
jgi:nucleoside-diphosphate-sugar epimerase